MKESISHLRIFGYVFYAHVPEEIRRKLDDKREKCVLVGYNEKLKEYKLYNPVTKNTIVTGDVKFTEDQSWSDEVEGIVCIQPFSHATEPVDIIGQQEPTHRLPQLQVQGEYSIQEGQGTHSPTSTNESDPTLTSLRK